VFIFILFMPQNPNTDTNQIKHIEHNFMTPFFGSDLHSVIA
jgi:hypothetical protein